MKIWEALYNGMTFESSYATLSLHKTEQGARDAVAKYVRKKRKDHDSLYDYDVKKMSYRFGEFEAWGVRGVEVLD